MYVCMYACMYAFMYVCQPAVYLPVCLSLCLYVCVDLPVCLSICMSMFVCVCLSRCFSAYPSVCLSICLSVCLSVFLGKDVEQILTTPAWWFAVRRHGDNSSGTFAGVFVLIGFEIVCECCDCSAFSDCRRKSALSCDSCMTERYLRSFQPWCSRLQ